MPHARLNDNAVSPVVGTILMVAVTVALAATVLAVMNGFGSETPSESTDATFKVAGVDGDGDGLSDAVKVTYITGPSNVPNGDVVLTMNDGTDSLSSTSTATTWSPGDFRIYDFDDGDPLTTSDSKGSWFVTISILGTTVFDGTVTLQE